MRIAIVIVLALLLGTCSQKPNQLEQVLESGELRVVTRNSPTTFYLGAEGPAGFEHDLAQLFAERLGVGLVMYAPEGFPGVLNEVRHGRAHFAAAGLSITESRKKDLRFGPPYQEVTQQLVYRYGVRRPRELDEIKESNLTVMSGTSHEDLLRELSSDYPNLAWESTDTAESEELLQWVSNRVIDYTIADSTEIALARRFYPEIRVAFDMREPEPIAWAFRRGDDDSLYMEAVKFINETRQSGLLSQIADRYYGYTDKFDYVGTRIYMRHIDSRLPAYREMFDKAGEFGGIDWRLLAAMGYQESHWNPRAVSPTGVRGIMMLTKVTAQQLGVENRSDPESSILGGAQYLQHIKNRIPERIPEPDRTWMALAAYNIGRGHLEDARVLTVSNGGDPDRWMDVRENLPLLSQKKWYSRTKHGYARGREPVKYVENIRSYYDILVWIINSRENTEPLNSTVQTTMRST
ncbi:MAG: membrane-bound lytic murein transglycosylase MltF [Gammaproteobacteria bacterium]